MIKAFFFFNLWKTQTFYLGVNFYPIKASDGANTSQEMGVQQGQRKSVHEDLSWRKVVPGEKEPRVLGFSFKAYSPCILKATVYWPTFSGYVQDY